MRMRRPIQFLSFLGATLPVWGGAGLPFEIEAAGAPPPVARPAAPHLFPDYAGIVIPPNMAPLNFRVEEPQFSTRTFTVAPPSLPRV